LPAVAAKKRRTKSYHKSFEKKWKNGITRWTKEEKGQRVTPERKSPTKKKSEIQGITNAPEIGKEKKSGKSKTKSCADMRREGKVEKYARKYRMGRLRGKKRGGESKGGGG